MPFVTPPSIQLSTPVRPRLARALFLAALCCALASLPRPAVAQTPVATYGLGRLYSSASSSQGELVTGGAKDIIVWSAATGSKERILSGHTDKVLAVASSADGKRVFTGSQDGTARLWDLETGALLQTYPHQASSSPIAVSDVSISSAGTRLLTFGADGYVRIFDGQSTQPLQTLQYPQFTSSLSGAKLSASGAQAVILDRNSSSALNYTIPVRVWDVAQRRASRILKHTMAVQSAAFSPDEKFILTGSDDKIARIWNLETGATSFTLSGHASAITEVGWSTDGSRVLTLSKSEPVGITSVTQQGFVFYSYGPVVRIWDAQSGQQIYKITDFNKYGALTHIAFASDAGHLLAQSGDGCARVIEIASGEALAAIGEYWGAISSLTFAPDGTSFILGSDGRRATQFSHALGKTLGVYTGHQSALTAVGISPSGRKVLTASLDKTARVHNAQTGALLNVLQGHTSHVTCAALVGDDTKALTGSDDKTVRLWDLKTSQTLFTFSEPTTSVSSLAVSADGKKALVGDWSGTVHIYDLQQRKRTAAYSDFSYAVTSLALSPDGTKALVGGCDATTFTARLIDLTSTQTQTLQNFAGHRDDIIAVAFSPNGNRILTASFDHTVKLWGINGRLLLTLSGFGTDYITAIAFSPDGTRALTGGSDGIVRLWDVSKNGVGLWDRFE